MESMRAWEMRKEQFPYISEWNFSLFFYCKAKLSKNALTTQCWFFIWPNRRWQVNCGVFQHLPFTYETFSQWQAESTEFSRHLDNRPANHSTRVRQEIEWFYYRWDTSDIYTCVRRQSTSKKRRNKKTINDIIIIRNKHAT